MPLFPQDKIGSLDDLALADLLRTDLLPEIEDVSSDSGGGGDGGCWPGIGTILGWDQQQQAEPISGLQFLRSTESQYQQQQPQQQQQQADLLDLKGEVFSDIEVSEAVDRSLAKLVSAE